VFILYEKNISGYLILTVLKSCLGGNPVMLETESMDIPVSFIRYHTTPGCFPGWWISSFTQHQAASRVGGYHHSHNTRLLPGLVVIIN
jgi:hypothetical protein